MSEQTSEYNVKYGEWNCENPKCIVRLRVKISEQGFASIVLAPCPVCGTMQEPPFHDGACFDLEYYDGDGWNNA